jgi:MFS family permease
MSKNIRLFYLFNFLTDFSLFAPIAILYFSQVSGSYLLGMSVFSAIFISQSLFELPTGLFSDHFGRKKTIILGSLAGLISVLFFAISYNYFLLLLGAIFEGLGRASFSGNNDAYLYDLLSESNQKINTRRF